MLEQYLPILDELESEIMTDSHAHEDDPNPITIEYIDCAMKAVDLLKNYINTMNKVYDN